MHGLQQGARSIVQGSTRGGYHPSSLNRDRSGRGGGGAEAAVQTWNCLFILVRSPYTKKVQGRGSCYSTVEGQSWGVGLPVGGAQGADLGISLHCWNGDAAPRGRGGLGFSESHGQLAQNAISVVKGAELSLAS